MPLMASAWLTFYDALYSFYRLGGDSICNTKLSEVTFETDENIRSLETRELSRYLADLLTSKGEDESRISIITFSLGSSNSTCWWFIIFSSSNIPKSFSF